MISVKKIGVWIAIIFVSLLLGIGWWVRNPVFFFDRSVAPEVQSSPKNLKNHVEFLSGLAPNRNHTQPDQMKLSQNYIAEQLSEMGYEIELQEVPSEGNVFPRNDWLFR